MGNRLPSICEILGSIPSTAKKKKDVDMKYPNTVMGIVTTQINDQTEKASDSCL
jgi:hypothetical protein